LQFHSTFGNPGGTRRLQTKLTINTPGDQYEQEADRVAEQVMRMPDPSRLERRHEGRATGSLFQNEQDNPSLPRQLATDNLRGAQIPPIIHEVLRSPGEPLDAATRAFMEPRFGQDFRDVRVHTDLHAASSAEEIGARAFTLGAHLAFGQNKFSPTTADGRKLVAHELAHIVQQRKSALRIQRQPTKPDKEKFDFQTADVHEGQEVHQEVIAVNRPTDPAEFLDAFEEKARRLVVAENTWFSNNMIEFTRDTILKEKRNPYANIKIETLRDVAGKAFEKAIAALAVKGGAKAVGSVVKLIYIGQKVLYVGQKASRFTGLGGLLTTIASALVQAIIGPLFDKTDELVKQALSQFAEAMKSLNELIITKAMDSAVQFHDFMTSLKDYVLGGSVKAKGKAKAPPGSSKFSIGQGDYTVQVQLDTAEPMTPRKEQQVILDLANVVVGIDAVMPHLTSDLSLYQELALRAGVHSGDVAKATPKQAPDPTKLSSTYDKTFDVSEMVIGETKLDVPKGGSVVITSEAYYTDSNWKQMPDATRPPSEYTIDLYETGSGRHGDRAVKPTGQFDVGASGTRGWYKLAGGKYYLVIEKHGNPNFTLRGKLHIEIRQS